MTVTPANRFDPTTIRFGPNEKNRNGGKFVPFVDAQGSRMFATIQTPTLAIPFGISAYRNNPDSDPDSYNIDVSVRGIETDPRVAEFLDKMRQLDDYLIDAAVENSEAWFGKQKSREVLEDTYRRLVKEHPQGKYPAVMKVRLPMREGKVVCSFFDADRKPMAMEDVAKGSTVKLIIEANQIWQVNSNWGITWKARQVLVVTKPQRLNDFAFDDDDADINGDIDDASAFL